MGVVDENIFPKLILDGVTSDPAAPSNDNWKLYAKPGGVYARSSNSIVGPFGAGLADQGAFTFMDATEAAAPATPASGYARIYAKTDGRIYSKDDAGVEYGPFDAAGAGGSDPLLYVDDIALHADGDDMSSTALASWTKVGSGSATAVTTELYDATCIDLQFSAQSDRLWKAVDAGDWTYYLTLHGATNSTPDSNTALGGMIGLAATNDAGTGTGVSLYSDNQGYMWGVTSHAYASSGSSLLSGWNTIIPAAASNWPVVYRLAKSSTTITGGISFNGGATWKTATRADSTTFTQIAIVRLFTGGGTTPTLRLGRFNLVP